MTNITLQKQYRTLWHFIPGLALSAVITGVALWGGSIPAVAGAGFSALTLAILLGMVLGNTIYPHIWKSCDGGVLFAKQYLLRLGIILYGFRLTFSQIADVGISGIIIDVLTLSSTFLLACFLGQKVFGLDKHTSWLIGAGSSICGGHGPGADLRIADAASGRHHPAGRHRSDRPAAAHEVAQVVAAGHAISPDAENAAVISKMLRVMMLAPFLILLAARVKQLSGANSGEKSKITIPWFAILFIVVAIFNSFHLLPQSVVNMLVTLDTFLLAMAMAALGLTTHVSALKKAGAKPLLMALVLFAWLIVGGGAINYVIQSVIA